MEAESSPASTSVPDPAQKLLFIRRKPPIGQLALARRDHAVDEDAKYLGRIFLARLRLREAFAFQGRQPGLSQILDPGMAGKPIPGLLAFQFMVAAASVDRDPVPALVDQKSFG